MTLVCLGWALAAFATAALALHARGAAFIRRHFRRGPALRAGIVGCFAVVGTACLGCGLRAEPGWAMACPVALLTVSLLTAAAMARLGIATAAASRPRVVLAVGAHPDDLELACGGTLARFADAGHEVHGVLMTSGAAGGDSCRRRAEAEEGARFLGFTTLDVLDFPDTNLPLCEGEMTRAIEAAIAAYQPDVVLTHSIHDQHQDHVATHLASLRAARSHHSILCYESPSTTRAFNPSVYFDIDEYVEVKVHAVALHGDQAGKRYTGRQVVEGTAAFRGHQVKRRRAEGFEVVRLLADQAGVF